MTMMLFGSLSSARYEDGTTEYKNPDETGNLYASTNRKDRIYDKGGKLRKDNEWYYHYDEQGNLRLKTRSSAGSFVEEPKKTEFTSRFLLPDGEIYDNRFDQKAEIRKYSKWELKEYDRIRKKQEEKTQQTHKEQKAEWQKGDWEYLWYSNGMLRQIKKPDGSLISFEYDALGRRTAKIVEDKTEGNKIYRYIWEGNVLLHEWGYALEERPKLVTDAEGTIKYDREEPVENVTTWVYERGSFTPCAKLVGKEKYSIISNYLGTPVQAYNGSGELVWERELDIYGNVKKGNSNSFIPFLYPGQYVDIETGLAYNRFRYYNPETGLYLSKDPIGLTGGIQLYSYVSDSNKLVDPLGLMPVEADIISAQAEQLSKMIPGLGSEQASSILTGAYNRGAESVTFGGSRVRGNYNIGSDLDVGFTGINANQAGKITKANNKLFDSGKEGWLKMEETKIVPGNSTPNIEKITSPEEFFQRSGIRSGADAKAGQPFGASGSITAHSNGEITKIDTHGNKTTINYK